MLLVKTDSCWISRRSPVSGTIVRPFWDYRYSCWMMVMMIWLLCFESIIVAHTFWWEYRKLTRKFSWIHFTNYGEYPSLKFRGLIAFNNLWFGINSSKLPWSLLSGWNYTLVSLFHEWERVKSPRKQISQKKSSSPALGVLWFGTRLQGICWQAALGRSK